MTADNMYSPHNWEKFQERLQTQLSGKGKIMSAIFIAFLKSTSNFVHLWKKISSIAQIFPKFLTPKNVLPWMPKSLFQKTLRKWKCSRVPNTAQICMEHFYPNVSLIKHKFGWKTCFQIRSKILGLFVNTLTAHTMYSPQNW